MGGLRNVSDSFSNRARHKAATNLAALLLGVHPLATVHPLVLVQTPSPAPRVQAGAQGRALWTQSADITIAPEALGGIYMSPL